MIERREPTCHRKLRRFWITLPQDIAEHSAYKLGIGVTEDSRAAALHLVADSLFNGELPPDIDIIEDIDLSTLDAEQILPHVGISAVRGIWFPRV